MRTLFGWVRWRIRRIPRKLGFAKHRALWLYRDMRNGLRIAWELRLQGKPLADITRYERRIGSQNGEDGVLEAIVAKIGTTDRYFVEFGSGNLSLTTLAALPFSNFRDICFAQITRTRRKNV